MVIHNRKIGLNSNKKGKLHDDYIKSIGQTFLQLKSSFRIRPFQKNLVMTKEAIESYKDENDVYWK